MKESIHVLFLQILQSISAFFSIWFTSIDFLLQQVFTHIIERTWIQGLTFDKWEKTDYFVRNTKRLQNYML